MSYETQIPLRKADVQHVVWYGGVDNSITVAAVPAFVFDKIGDHMITAHHSDDKAM